MIDDVINWFKQAYDNLITWIDVVTTDVVEIVKDVFYWLWMVFYLPWVH